MPDVCLERLSFCDLSAGEGEKLLRMNPITYKGSMKA